MSQALHPMLNTAVKAARAAGALINRASIFALARTVGWIAQWNELIADPEQKIGRPRQLFQGKAKRDFVPMAKRK